MTIPMLGLITGISLVTLSSILPPKATSMELIVTFAFVLVNGLAIAGIIWAAIDSER